MTITAIFLRNVISTVLSHFSATTDEIMEYFLKSPAFQQEKEGLIRIGLSAYLNNDCATACHLWIPQIEEAIRQLAKKIGIEVLKIDPYSHGYNYRDLGNLLDDARLIQAFGPAGQRLVFYFNIVLNDKFGWNLRNDLCHGLLSSDSFNYAMTDRLFHIMLLLSGFRHPTNAAAQAEAVPI